MLSSPTSFRLTTFGGLTLTSESAELTGRTTQRRRLALLALLAVARDRGLTRDRLLGLLWPEHDEGRGRHALAQAIYALRQQLGESAIITGVDDVRLNPAVVTSDVAEFDAALAAGDLERAAALHAGPFLDGFYLLDTPEFERWVDDERQRLTTAYAAMLEKLAQDAERSGRPHVVVQRWRQRAALDPLDSGVACRLMEALAAAGDRAGAVQHALIHAALLREQLDLDPDPGVTAVAERLRKATTNAELRDDSKRRDTATDDSSPPRAPRPAVRRYRVWWVAGAATGVAIVGAIAITQSKRPVNRGPTLVVIGSIGSSDPTLAVTIREALRAELEAAPGIRVLGERRTDEILRLMKLAPDVAITRDIAVEVAQRGGASLAITGSADALGSGTQLLAQLIDARSAATLESLSERPEHPDDVIAAVTRIAAALRERVTGAPVDRSVEPLPAVTTTSLDALRNYARARQALLRLDRDSAIVLLEGALVHDSMFALAHYLLGDLLWYVDRQSHSEQHLRRALELSERMPARERLVVRARYEHLVSDRPDSALVYWELLRAGYPNEPLAYEGMTWALLAVGRPADAARAAESALRLDSAGATPHARNRMYGLMGMGDTAGALAFARSVSHIVDLRTEVRVTTALLRGDASGAVVLIDSVRQHVRAAFTWQRHAALLALGRLEEGAAECERIVAQGWFQAPPRAHLMQARAELAFGKSTEEARARIRRALAWLEKADISPPAVARIAEHVATIAVQANDSATLATVRRLIVRRDGGRGLRSYRLARYTIDAATHAQQGEYRVAAALADSARQGMFWARSLHSIIMMEADARVALGERERADSLYRVVATRAVHDGDHEMWASMQPIAVRALTRTSQPETVRR